MTSIEKIVVVLIVCIVAAIGFCAYAEVKQQPDQYSAWCKVHPEVELTLEEWRILNRNHQLPGQTDADVDPVVVIHN